MESPLMTIPQAMAFFLIEDIRTFRKFCRKHKIPYCTIGCKKVFHRDVLEQIAKKIQSTKTYATL